jgi:single-stranded DNA-binding protein
MSIPLNTDAVLATDPKLVELGEHVKCELFVFIPDLKKTKGGREDHPIPYEVWGNSGRACFEHLGKGSTVILNGTLNYEEYTGKDGQQSRWFGSGRVKFVRIKRNGVYVDGSDAADQALRDEAFRETNPAAGDDTDIPF